MIAGRGYGKTITGSQWVHDEVDRRPGAVGFLAARTLQDVERVMLSHPRAGLLATARPWNPCTWKRGDQQLVYRNGSRLQFFSSERPDQARGPEHDFGWGDEFATWTRVSDVAGNTLKDNLLMGLRGGTGGPPQALFTSTPRPSTKEVLAAARRRADEMRALLGEAAHEPIRITRGRMLDNAANLPPEFVAELLARYRGTRLGRQELEGEILDAIEGALWQDPMFEAPGFRVPVPEPSSLRRVVVAVDPAVSTEEGSNRTGIVKAARGWDDHLYAITQRSAVASPAEWARRALELAAEEPVADAIVGERNNGGDLVEANIRANGGRHVRFINATATRGKAKRAEPIASLYEQGRAHHCGDADQWSLLEYQMTMTDAEDYKGDGSPDDLDALVWAASELMLGIQHSGVVEDLLL